MIYQVSYLRLALAVFVVLSICMMASTAKAPAATLGAGERTILTIGVNKSIPTCVKARQRISMLITFKNITADLTEKVTARLGYVASSIKTADANSVVIASGTDPMLGGLGNKHWSSTLAPKQSITKRLVVQVQPPMDQKSSPPKWGFTMLIYVAHSNRGPAQLRIVRPYCTPQSNA
jgi:hypothetical protein